MKEAIIRTKSLTKKYHNTVAVNSVNMTVEKGEIYGLIGKNGAGKTTLLRMISGLTIPSEGQIELFEETSQEGLGKARMRTGCTIETPAFYPYLSAEKNLEYYRLQRGIPDKEVIKETLKVVGLDKAGKKSFKNFSLGMKQRLGIALAIMGSPDLLILDEPTNGLDPIGIVEIREILLKLNREKNITIIVSSHILSELSQMATTYGFINNGKIVEEISSKKLKEKLRTSISIKVDSTQKAAVILEKQLNCSDYEVLAENEINIYDYIDRPEEVSDAIVTGGVKLYSLYQNGSKLENYFMDLVGGNNND